MNGEKNHLNKVSEKRGEIFAFGEGWSYIGSNIRGAEEIKPRAIVSVSIGYQHTKKKSGTFPIDHPQEQGCDH